MDKDAAALKEHYRRYYSVGLSTVVSLVKFSDELSPAQLKNVAAAFAHGKPNDYVYRVQGDVILARYPRTKADRENGRIVAQGERCD